MPVSAGRTCLWPDMSASCWLSLIALQPIHLPTPSRKGTHMNLRITAALALLTLGAGAHAASLSATGYAQNFNGMGTGNVAPEGWSVLTGNSGTSNSTWTTTIPGNGSNSVASLVATNGVLAVVTTPTGTNNNGFNAAASASSTDDRVLATSPTTVSGGALPPSLSNDTGHTL